MGVREARVVKNSMGPGGRGSEGGWLDGEAQAEGEDWVRDDMEGEG